ncbi:hypothetical protein KEM52_000543 [Ascosphaera acerosa]|nr:hypothetical protein KEM52_000543 [Ascosphaera acerosa]
MPAASSPSYVVEPVTEADFPALLAATYDAFADPFYEIIHVFFPPDRADGARRELREFQAAPPGELVWLKAYDARDPQRTIVGGAKWYFHQRPAYGAARSQMLPTGMAGAAGADAGVSVEGVQGRLRRSSDQDDADTGSWSRHPLDAVTDWYPAGSVQREFATQVQRSHNRPRALWTEGQAHAYLNVAFTIPSARRTGVATRLLEWGVRRADELGLECYLEASSLGAPVYRKHGFVDGPVVLAEPVVPAGYGAAQRAEWDALVRAHLPSASLEIGSHMGY